MLANSGLLVGMVRSLLYILCCSGLFFLLNSTSFAAALFNDGSEIEVQWYEKQGKILNEHVCFNYKKDKRKYRECRKQASTYFADECKFFTDKIKMTQKKYQDLYTGEKEKFCNASETYLP